MSIVLSKRMQAILDCVPVVSALADIGTDHAFIPISAIETGKAKHAIATDLRQGPLDKARLNVNQHGLSDAVTLRLGDGLAPLQVGEVDVIVSAGIGGHVHSEMIQSHPDIARAAKLLIFQPMNAGHTLRRRLDEDGYSIVDELLVIDEDRIYEIIAASHEAQVDAYQSFRGDDWWMRMAYTYGPRLLDGSSELLQLRLRREWDKRERILKSVQKGTAEDTLLRAEALKQEIQDISRVIQATGGMGQ